MLYFANAKINLGLHILNKREDGYHNIETLFYPIGWRDALEIIPAAATQKESIQLFLYGSKEAIPQERNLVVKAYRVLEKQYQLPSIEVHLLKSIPSGAGLGGGSADAAWMLKALNSLYHLGLSNSQLEAYGAQLGADCPFFIHNRPMIAQGIGDILTPSPLSLEGYYLLLIKPDIHIATAAAYAGVSPQDDREPIATILSQPITQWRELLVNDFERSLLVKHQQLQDIKQQLYDSGAIYAAMSGSGSTIFGIFNTPAPQLDIAHSQQWSQRL